MGLAPWCEGEVWTYGVDAHGKRWARVDGRLPCPANLKRNIAWWFRNDFEQQLPAWFHPEWDLARREAYWKYVRNPLQNARLFVWGWADQNYVVTVDEGDPDPMVVQRNDVQLPDGTYDTGVQRCTLTRADGATRKFVSSCGKRVVWYYGTQPSGIFGGKIVPARSLG